MQISFSKLCFLGKPQNYRVIDNVVSRSAQPMQEDFAWLKEQGVTDIINFRTMHRPDVSFDEENVVKGLGLKYHSIPSVTMKPSEKNVNTFLDTVEQIKERGGKAHIHCKAGADRTGMYAFIYKIKNGLGTLSKNQAEWFEMGYHYKLYPTLLEWARNFVTRYK